MGGLCSPLITQRRLSNSVFRCLTDWIAASLDKTAFHINIHKFIALIINAFFMMMYFTNLHRQGSPILTNIDGWIFLLEADNTSVLIWMYKLSCMQESHIVNLCHLFYHIILYFNTLFPSHFDGKHTTIILNLEADTLSCPQDHPTYEQIFQPYPEMASL